VRITKINKILSGLQQALPENEERIPDNRKWKKLYEYKSKNKQKATINTRQKE
jgi:hypothetical protein